MCLSLTAFISPRFVHRVLLLACACALLVLAPRLALAQRDGDRSIIIGFNSLSVSDEDDSINNDEPYLIVTKFRLRVRVNPDGSSVSIVPGTLQVALIMSGHNNLGRSDDDWADERRRPYDFPLGIPRFVQEVVPWDEDGWIVGAVVVHMEEDAFDDRLVRLLATRIEASVRGSISTMTFSPSIGTAIGNSIARRLLGDISHSFNNRDFGGLLRELISVVDPDDFGGMAIVLTATGPGNTVFMFAGLPPAAATLPSTGVTAVTTSNTFSLSFPAGDLSMLPPTARFRGHHILNGDVRIGRLDAPF